MLKNILNLGDAALYCDFGKEVNKETNANVIKYFKNVKEKQIEGITNITPSYNKLIISFDLNFTNFHSIKKKIENLELKDFINIQGKLINIPICCDENFALDIKRLEKKLNISKDKIYEKFFSKEYYCYMTGFIAGHPFLGDIDEALRAKRLETPRVKIPKGSVGITEQFCNIYSFESPGGWNIIGNTPLNIFDKSNELTPNLINPGDSVKFNQITTEEYKKKIIMNHFKVIRPGINTTFQDLGRKNLYHFGIPFSGAMDNRNYLLSNAIGGNKEDAPVIEFAFQGPLLKFKGEKINFNITGNVNFNIIKKENKIEGNCYQNYILEDGDELDIISTNNSVYGYLTVSGNFDVQFQWGSCSTTQKQK